MFISYVVEVELNEQKTHYHYDYKYNTGHVRRALLFYKERIS